MYTKHNNGITTKKVIFLQSSLERNQHPMTYGIWIYHVPVRSISVKISRKRTMSLKVGLLKEKDFQKKSFTSFSPPISHGQSKVDSDLSPDWGVSRLTGGWWTALCHLVPHNYTKYIPAGNNSRPQSCGILIQDATKWPVNMLFQEFSGAEP